MAAKGKLIGVSARRVQAAWDWAARLAEGPGAFALRPEVTAVQVVTGRKGPGLAGARHFTRQEFARLRLKNPNVAITHSPAPKDNEAQARLTVQLAGTVPREFDLFNLSKEEIVQLLQREFAAPASATPARQ